MTASNQSNENLGQMLFRYRDYTPIPLIILLLIFQKSTVFSVTIGTLMILFGEMIRIYSVSLIGSISRTRKDRTGGSLIKEGPFGVVRNPLYVGNFFIAVGVAVFGGSFFVIVLTVVLFCIQYYHIVKYEETLLTETFGDEYHQYCREVPAWIPNKKIDIDNLDRPGSLSIAFHSERRTLMAIIAIITLLIVVS